MMSNRHRPHRDYERDTAGMNPLKPKRARIAGVRSEIEDVRTYIIKTEIAFFAMPGQFNMIGYPGVGEAPISLSSIVRKNSFEHTIRYVGRVTRFLEGFKEGDEIFLRGPYGRGWPLNKAQGKNILLIAGGVGIAPIRPVVQMILDKRESFGNVGLIYGARNDRNVLYMDEFDKWGKKISLYLTVDEITGRRGNRVGWKHNVGLVTDLLDKIKISPDNTFAFVCGPEIMMRFICRGLLMKGITQSRIYVSLERRMKCGIAHCGHCQHYGLFVCKDGPVFSYKEVRGLPDGFL